MLKSGMTEESKSWKAARFFLPLSDLSDLVSVHEPSIRGNSRKDQAIRLGDHSSLCSIAM